MCPEAPDRAEAASRALPLALPGGFSSAQRRGRGGLSSCPEDQPDSKTPCPPGFAKAAFSSSWD